jgi:AraC-like DNA-binding protein
LLRETSLRISQIAERLGYSDLNKFEQAFKRRFSTAPTCYRKTQRNAAEL